MRAQGIPEDKLDFFWKAYNTRTAKLATKSAFDNIGTGPGKVEMRSVDLGEATVDPVTNKVKIGDLVVDGVVAATGQVANLPPGMKDIKFTLVVVDVEGRPRLTGLDPVGADGKVIPGMRLVGAQAINPAMADHIVPGEVARFHALADEASQLNVPELSKGVKGSIHQTNKSVPAAVSAMPNTPAPLATYDAPPLVPGTTQDDKDPGDGISIMRAADGPAPSRVPHVVIEVLDREQGSPLPDPDRWSQRVGGDVRSARIIKGDGAAQAAKALQARAFTVGNRVFFGIGVDEATDGGDLLAHELTHVTQQAGSSAPPSWGQLPIVDHGDPREVAARAHEGSGATGGQAIAMDRPQSKDAIGYVYDRAVFSLLKVAIAQVGMVKRGPFGDLLSRKPGFEAMFNWYLDERMGGLGQPSREYGTAVKALGRLVAPESVEEMIDRSRGHDWDYSDENNPVQKSTGPASSTYASPVAVDIANAIARHYIESIKVMFPQFVSLYLDAKSKVTPETPIGVVFSHNSALVPANPMDSLVIAALWDAWLDLPLEDIAANHPEIASRPTSPLAGTELPAIEFKAKEGLYHWFAAGTAPASQVATALFRPITNRDMREDAYRLISVPPLWGFHASDIPSFKDEHIEALRRQWGDDARAMAPAAGAPATTPPMPAWPSDVTNGLGLQLTVPFGPPAVDPIAELSGRGAQRAYDHVAAAATPEAGKDEASVASRLSDDLRVLDSIGRVLDVIGRDAAPILAVRERLAGRYDDATNTTVCTGDAPTQFALADQQGDVLADIASALNEAAMKFVAYGAGQSEANPVRQLIDDCAAPLVDAIVALDFPDVARSRSLLGIQRVRSLDISVQEANLHSGMPVVDAGLRAPEASKDFDAGAAEQQTNQLAYDLGAMRMQQTTDPAGATKDLAAAGPKVNDLEFDIQLGDKLVRLNEWWQAVDAEEDFWEDIPDRIEGQWIKDENHQLYSDFLKQVKKPFEDAKAANDEVGKKAARDAFATLVARWMKLAEKIRPFVLKAERHKKWNKIIVGIAIAVVAFALGQFEFAAILAEAGAAATTGTVIEAAISGSIVATSASVVLEKLILNQDPTLGSLITGFVGNVAMFGIVGKLALTARAAGVALEATEATVGAVKAADAAGAGAKVATVSAKLAKFTFQTVMGEVIVLVQSEVQNLIDKRAFMSIAELEETAAMGVVNIIGMHVGQHAFDGAIEAFRGSRAAKGIDLEGLFAERKALRDDGAKLHEAAGGDDHLASGKAPRATAQELVARWQKYFEREQEVVKKLSDLAEKHPEAFKGKVAELEKLRGAEAEDEAMSRQFRQASALLGLQEMAPNLYRGDPAALDAILSQHKAAGGELVDVTTDPHTGQRSLKIKTADGTPIEVVEKLPDVGERKPPKVSVGTARFFEDWLTKLDTTTPEGKQVHQRLLEYYARDPEAAIKLATERYKFAPGEMPENELIVQPDAPEVHEPKGGKKAAAPTEAPPTDAARAFDHYQYTRESEQPNVSKFGDDKVMSRSDFEAMYKAGFEYDPVKGGFEARKGATPAGGAGPLGGTGGTQILGVVPSEAVGHEVMRKLVSGEAEALRIVGIEPPPDFDSRTNEWGLGRKADGSIVLIRGGKGAVDWSLIPEVEDIAHSHPFIDPVTGKERRIKGENGSGTIDLNALKLSGASDRALMDLLYLMPSTGDLKFVALGGRGGHRVHTPYVSLGDGKIGNPVAGGDQPTVEIVISHAEPVGLLTADSEIVVYKGELVLYAGDQIIGTLDIYQRYHQSGSFAMDWVTLEMPPDVVPLPADHPIGKYLSTPAGEQPVNFVSAETVEKLVDKGFPDPAKNPAIKEMLENVNKENAATLGELAFNDHIVGFDKWLKRIQDNPRQIGKALQNLEKVKAALIDDPTLRIEFDADGVWEDDATRAAASAKKAITDQRRAEAQATKLTRTREALRVELSTRGGGVDVDTWLSRVTALFDGDVEKTRILELMRLHLTDPAPFMAEVDLLLTSNRIPADLHGALVKRALAPDLDHAQFLADARWLADRDLAAATRATLLDRASDDGLDLEWLRTTSLTDAQLDQLGGQTIPWNQFQEAAGAAARGESSTANANATKASQQAIRGVAGEEVAKTIKLPGGFELQGEGTVADDGKLPDYALRSPTGELADLEVKATRPSELMPMIDSVTNGGKAGPIDRMLKQLIASKGRVGRRSFLAVSDGLLPSERRTLQTFLENQQAMPDEILYMPEADIAAIESALLTNLGIPSR